MRKLALSISVLAAAVMLNSGLPGNYGTIHDFGDESAIAEDTELLQVGFIGGGGFRSGIPHPGVFGYGPSLNYVRSCGNCFV